MKGGGYGEGEEDRKSPWEWGLVGGGGGGNRKTTPACSNA